MADHDKILQLFQQAGYPYDTDYVFMDNWCVEHIRTNTYVRYQPGKDIPLWRPYLEPIDNPGGIEMNYVFKHRWSALWAALVAAVVYRKNRTKPDALDKVVQMWDECGLKPDYKISPKKQEPKSEPSDESFAKAAESLFGGTGIFGDGGLGDFNSIFGKFK